MLGRTIFLTLDKRAGRLDYFWCLLSVTLLLLRRTPRRSEAFSVTDSLILTDDDLAKHWHLVEAADRKELAAFVKFKCFRARHRLEMVNTNELDCVWVRRWKASTNSDGTTTWIIKSRLCGRGFLDKQKLDIDKHSSTASRISQRIAIFIAVQYDLDVESWDIGNAFLQGLSFEELARKAKDLGYEVKG